MVSTQVGALLYTLYYVWAEIEIRLRHESVLKSLNHAHDSHQLHLELNLAQIVKHLLRFTK